MTDAAKKSIFERLRGSMPTSATPAPNMKPMGFANYGDTKEKLEHFTKMITAVNGEVQVTDRENWLTSLRDIIADCAIKALAYGPSGPFGDDIRTLSNQLELLAYDKPIEELKNELFEIDAGFTSTFGAIAETGSLILRPGSDEPRLLSLVPAIHIALLDGQRLFDTFWQAQTSEPNAWVNGMPTNALLISGPSKTADIEQTLTYGVHGPKRLIVIVAVDGLDG